MKIPLDSIISKIAGLGIPGFVLLAAMSTSGVAGGAAIVSTLALFGGPLGMLGGIGMLGVMVMISSALSQYGVEVLIKRVLAQFIAKGLSKERIARSIAAYPISRNLKRLLMEWLDAYFPTQAPDCPP
jgi:hypothetical protein